MARGRAATYDTQREAILAQAAALFAKGGYPATSMNGVAEACGISKPALYHYVRDKYALLVAISEDHVQRLEALVADVADEAARDRLAPEPHLRRLIERFVEEYADAKAQHRVLTEDVRFLEGEDRARVLDAERRVVAAFAEVIGRVRPEAAEVAKPLSMLLFGMINWMFTWLKPGGTLDHSAIAPMVADLFLGGVGAVRPPRDARKRSTTITSPTTTKETHA